MDKLSRLSLADLVVGAVVLVSSYVYARSQTSKLRHVPAFGVFANSLVLSFYDVFKFFTDSKTFLADGRKKVQADIVKVPRIFDWLLLVVGREITEELAKAPESEISFQICTNEGMQVRYTMGESIADKPDLHINIIRNRQRRAIPELIPDIIEEIAIAFDEFVDGPDKCAEWKAIPAQDFVMRAVCRASNRTFVGLPLCRNSEFIDLAINHAMEVIQTGVLLLFVPRFLRPIVNWMLPTKLSNRVKCGLTFLSPIIRDRREQARVLGDEYEPPRDALTWLMADAKGEEAEEAALVIRILFFNFASLHTTAMTLTQALYDLAVHPEYIEELRAEAAAAIREHGWTKEGMDKLVKIDSFIKETQRMRPVSSIILNRYAAKDFTLSNGFHIPQGTMVSVDSQEAHNDPEIYDNPYTFNPWRFLEMQERTGKKHDITVTSASFLAFGHGRHACPGRFFAASEMKVMMAYLVLNYEVKCQQEGVRPEDWTIAGSVLPDPKAKVMFRRIRPRAAL